jgi:hypothetical protein
MKTKDFLCTKKAPGCGALDLCVLQYFYKNY